MDEVDFQKENVVKYEEWIKFEKDLTLKNEIKVNKQNEKKNVQKKIAKDQESREFFFISNP